MSRPEDYALAVVVLVENYNWISFTQRFEGNDCIICQESLQNRNCLTTDCNCTYHSDCILKNVVDFGRTECPNCRVEYNFDPDNLC